MTKVRLALWFIAASLLALPALSQGPAVVEGKIVNGTNAASVPAGIQVDVISLGGGMRVLRSVPADASGRFRIDGLAAGEPMLLRAEYKSVNYYGDVNFDAAGKASAEIRVFEPTTSMQGIQLAEVRLGFRLSGDRLRSIESYTFTNGTSPPRSFMRPDGNFRFSKAAGILEPPRLDVTAPGSTMPVTQAPLESADGQSYYSLYPLKPGTTTFDVEQVLPYESRSYTYRKRFYEDVGSLKLAVIPRDMAVSGEGLSRVQTDTAQDFSVYDMAGIRAGTEVVWTFSGGTPLAESAPAAPPAAESRVQAMPTLVGQNALMIGLLLLIGFSLVLLYANNRLIQASPGSVDRRIKELKERREQLLDYVAALDAGFDKQAIEKREFQRLREQAKRNLRRIAMLLAKK